MISKRKSILKVCGGTEIVMTAASLLIPKFSARYLLDTYPLELALKK